MEIALTPAQARFVTADAPVVGFLGGRGAGKTFAGCYRVLKRARTGHSYLVVAPTYTMLRDVVWPRLLELGHRLRWIREISRSRLIVRFSNGAQVLFRSADEPDRLRGLSVSGAWVDEASLVPREVVDVVRFALREAMQAWLACTFTPKGRSHWTFELFGRPQPGVAVIRSPTVDNVFLPPDFMETVRANSSPLLLAQELEGEFVDIEGADWPSQYWGEWVWVPHLPRRERWTVSAIAVDPSLGKTDKPGDYSAIVLVVIADGLLWVQADLQRRSPEKLVRDVLVACDQHQPTLVGIEANQFQELLVHEFVRAGGEAFGARYPVFQIKNNTSKLVRIRRLGPYIIRRELRVVDDPGGRLLVQQLQEFPFSKHDDGPDALEMAVRLILETAGGRYCDRGWFDTDAVFGVAGQG